MRNRKGRRRAKSLIRRIGKRSAGFVFGHPHCVFQLIGIEGDCIALGIGDIARRDTERLGQYLPVQVAEFLEQPSLGQPGSERLRGTNAADQADSS